MPDERTINMSRPCAPRAPKKRVASEAAAALARLAKRAAVPPGSTGEEHPTGEESLQDLQDLYIVDGGAPDEFMNDFMSFVTKTATRRAQRAPQ